MISMNSAVTADKAVIKLGSMGLVDCDPYTVWEGIAQAAEEYRKHTVEKVISGLLDKGATEDPYRYLIGDSK